jgi:hypothetical protein
VTNSRSKAATPEITFNEDRRANLDNDIKETVQDIELVEAEPADGHSPVQSDSRTGGYNLELLRIVL